MQGTNRFSVRVILLFSVMASLTLLSTRLRADTGTCGDATTTLPFTDVAGTNIFFCSIAEAFFSGLANGTSATTYDPSGNVTREQMAAFITRTMDQSITRSSRRAVRDEFWITQRAENRARTALGNNVFMVKSDGVDMWVTGDDKVFRVRGSDGRLVETWTGANLPNGVLVAMGKVFVTGQGNASVGIVYQIDPTQPSGAVGTLATGLGLSPRSLAFDGERIWTANVGSGSPSTGSISIVTVNPVTVTNINAGFNDPLGIIYDGTNMWVTDDRTATFVDMLFKLDKNGSILLSVPVGTTPGFPAFDGTNIWVPNSSSSSVTVVRATGALAGTVLATLTGNGLAGPIQAAFDGERILVTNQNGNSVSLWRASDITPIGTFPAGSTSEANVQPFGACSDGSNFWIALSHIGSLARF